MKQEDKEAIFEKMYVSENQYDPNFRVTNILDKDQYLEYKIWEKENYKAMNEKHFPNRLVIRGENPNIIYHAHCLGCIRQRIEGVEICKNCKSFGYGNKRDLRIAGEDYATLSNDDFNKALNQK